MANLNKGSVRQLSVELQDFSSLIKKLHKELSKLEKGTNDYAEKQKQLNRAVADGVMLSRKLGVANNNLNKSNRNHKKSISEATKAQNNFKETVDNTSKSVGGSQILSYSRSFLPSLQLRTAGNTVISKAPKVKSLQ